jgi:hypothetical protein
MHDYMDSTPFTPYRASCASDTSLEVITREKTGPERHGIPFDVPQLKIFFNRDSTVAILQQARHKTHPDRRCIGL